MDLLLKTDKITLVISISRYSIHLYVIRQRMKIKNTCRYCLHCFNGEKVLMELKKVCSKVNRKQSVKLKSC